MTSSNSIATLIISITALAFVVWLALAHPAHESIYGPAPAAVVVSL